MNAGVRAQVFSLRKFTIRETLLATMTIALLLPYVKSCLRQPNDFGPASLSTIVGIEEIIRSIEPDMQGTGGKSWGGFVELNMAVDGRQKHNLVDRFHSELLQRVGRLGGTTDHVSDTSQNELHYKLLLDDRPYDLHLYFSFFDDIPEKLHDIFGQNAIRLRVTSHCFPSPGK